MHTCSHVYIANNYQLASQILDVITNFKAFFLTTASPLNIDRPCLQGMVFLVVTGHHNAGN